MSYNVKALDMGPSRRSHQHGPPVLGRVQELPRSPTSSLVCSPPTPCPRRPRLRFPLPMPTSIRVLLLCHMADDTCTRQRVVRRRPLTGSPSNRDMSRRGEGLPGYWAVLFVRAIVEHPAGYASLLAHLTPRALLPSSNPALSAS